MKRFFLTIALCTSLLAGLSLFLFPVSQAADNPMLTLLNLPAPPPPNPEYSAAQASAFPEGFFDRSKPPPDDAPIEMLMEYWRVQATDYNEMRYRVYPSGRALERIFAEIDKKPERLTEFLNVLPIGDHSSSYVKGIYDRMSNGNEADRDRRTALRRWMKFNTPHYAAELAREAANVSDANGYVTNHDQLVALARVDWQRAGPIVTRLYNNPSQKASRTAALWALYAHAIESGSPSDTDRYRDELKEVVADKELPDGIRDLALDALSLEKEWSGRDEWYLSLLEDETLTDLGRYTGLTTMITSSPEEKFIDRMLALLDSDSIHVRTAAARNLMLKLDERRPHVLKALLPWLTNPKWLRETNAGGRNGLIMILARVKMPEAVPGLIAAVDEKETRDIPRYSTNANAAVANAMRAAANAMNAAAAAAAAAANSAADDIEEDARVAAAEVRSRSSANSPAANLLANAANTARASTYDSTPTEVYPYRYWAISALTFQEDPRAVPILRRLLNETEESYEKPALVKAILKSGGFTIAEQLTAIEEIARDPAIDEMNANANANLGYYSPNSNAGPGTFSDRISVDRVYRDGEPQTMSRMLGLALISSTDVSDELVRSVIDRIEILDKREPKISANLRRIALTWNGTVVNSLLLRDLKRNRVDTDSVLRLLSFREHLRATQQSDIFDIRTGGPVAVGISACLLEDPNDFNAIIDGSSEETTIAMLACARLIRAPLPVAKVAEKLQTKNALLELAAERYLESEDSAEARQIVLSRHPGEARILGASTAFFVPEGGSYSDMLFAMFVSVVKAPRFYPSQLDGSIGHSPYIRKIEKALQDEVRNDSNLLGVYNWEANYIRIYKDRAVLSWDEDAARYRERLLTKDEFDNFKGLIAHHKADAMPPAINCPEAGCEARQLLMLGRNGGRRVFSWTNSPPPLFTELTNTFADLRRSSPATVKYWAGKDVPGLEVLFADDKLDAKSVWKNGADFRLLVADKVRAAEIETEIQKNADETLESGEEIVEYEGIESVIATARSKREYDSFAWRAFTGGALGDAVAQPFEYIPLKDGLSVRPDEGQWKARAGGLEIRADDTGLYKLVGGKLTKIRDGGHSAPLVTPNGRWAVAVKDNEDYGSQIARINLLTNREYPVLAGHIPVARPIAYIASINRVLVGPPLEMLDYYNSDDEQVERADAGFYGLLDPETGSVIQPSGEIRPLVQQTHRPLQPGPGAFEFWAAVPSGENTIVGIYNTRNFNIKPVLKIPRIEFDSMDMWVEPGAGKIYFVYEGHLLSAPIKVGP